MKERLLAIDVLRGMTIMGMILVNNPGDWGSIYAPLCHAEWEGLTPTDLIYPFFMFLMGVSMSFSLPRLQERNIKERAWKIGRRTLLLVLIGMALVWTANVMWNVRDVINGESMSAPDMLFPWHNQRIPGVLQRLGLAYCFASIIILSFPKPKTLALLSALMLTAFHVILLLGNGFDMSHDNILFIVDKAVIGENRLYSEWIADEKFIFDPEGIIGTIPSVAHVIIGWLAGTILHKKENIEKRLLQLAVLGISLILAGWLVSYGCPVIKKVWTPSFALITCGAGMLVLTLISYIVDIRRQDRWCTLFRDYGMNPLFLYIAADFTAVVIGVVTVNGVSISAWIYEAIHSLFIIDKLSSLMYATAYVLFWGIVAVYLRKARIFIKL